MADFTFSESNSLGLQSKYNGKVRLFKVTWEDHILARPERSHLKFNAEKIATTLVHPDYVRESSADGPDVYLYYKEFPRWKMNEMIEVPTPEVMKYVVVVVDTRKRFIKTMYVARKIKQGKSIGG